MGTKYTHKTPYKLLCLIILGLIMINLMGISLVSAEDWKFNNRKSFDEEVGDYGKIIIKDWFGLKNLQTLQLNENTEFCGSNCSAKSNSTMYEDGVLLEDIRFIDLETGEEVNIKSYEILVDGEKYKLGEEVSGNSKGVNYNISLTGELFAFQSVDWQYKSQGYWHTENEIWTSDLNIGLVAYYDFDEGTGTNLEDKTLQGNNGTLINTTLWQSPGKLGLFALNFSKVDQSYVDVGNASGLITGNNLSISSWFRLDASDASTYLLVAKESTADGRSFRISTENSVPKFQVRNAGVIEATSNTSVTQNQWHNLVGVYHDGFNITIFLDGKMVAMVADTQNGFNVNAANLTIGRSLVATGEGFFNGTIDEVAIWNKTLNSSQILNLYNNGIGISPTLTGVSVNLNEPLNDTTIAKTTFNLTASYSPSDFVLDNATYYIWRDNNTLFNKSTFDIDTDFNVTNISFSGFTIDSYVWNIFACGNNATATDCSFATNNFTFSVGTIVNNYIFNVTTFETSTERFIANITVPSGLTPTNGKLIYNGTETTATITNIAGDNYTLIDTLNINPINIGNNNFSFKWDLGSLTQQSNETRQTVNPILFNLCNSTLNVSYINITFKNETLSLEDVNATISSTWIFWLGDGSVNKTLFFLNATENPNYQFCFDPPFRPMITEYTIDYNNAESQQRTWGATAILTNLSTTRILYLLPTSLGLFSPFQTVTSVGDPVSRVKAVITRTVGITTITSVIDFTDDSGFLSLFLNPEATYSAVFSKTGFPDNTFSFVPTTDIRTVTMGGGAQQISNGSQISYNTTYRIEPTNNSLTNNTSFDFKFIVNSTQTITFISMNITNSSGFQMGFQSDTSAGILSQAINTGNQTKIIGRYVIKTSQETITVSKVWTVGNEFIGDYSLFKQLDLFMDYEFRDFIRLIIVLATIMGVLIFMSKKETLDSSESKIAVALLLIWAFSLVGWLNTGLIMNSTSSNINTLGQFSNQYGIAILSTVAGSYFTLRRLFIRRI